MLGLRRRLEESEAGLCFRPGPLSQAPPSAPEAGIYKVTQALQLEFDRDCVRARCAGAQEQAPKGQRSQGPAFQLPTVPVPQPP